MPLKKNYNGKHILQNEQLDTLHLLKSVACNSTNYVHIAFAVTLKILMITNGIDYEPLNIQQCNYTSLVIIKKYIAIGSTNITCSINAT